MQKLRVNITGMTCVNCANAITRSVLKLDGVKSANVSLANNNAVFEYENITQEQIIEKIKNLGFGVSTNFEDMIKAQEKESLILKIRLMIAFICAVFIMLFSHEFLGNFSQYEIFSSFILCTISVVFCASGFYKHAFISIKEKNFDMNVLISLGVLGAYFYSIVAYFLPEIFGDDKDLHFYFDSPVMIILFVLFGKFLENKAKTQTRKYLNDLMQLRPKTANIVFPNGCEQQIKTTELKIGDIINVKSGEVISSDGIIINGGAHINESMLNGESLPSYKSIGKRVFEGTINTDGFLSIKVDKEPNQSVLVQIIQTMQDATSKKLNISRIADKISNIFVPIVIIISIFSLIVWSFFDLNQGILCAISVLIISCPCALGLAVPIAIICSLSKAAKYGIFIKNPAIIEIISLANIIAFDKTGTLTTGKMQVSKSNLNTENLNIASCISSLSSHPISQAIVNFHQNNTKINASIENFYGMGLKYNNNILLGNEKLLNKYNIYLDEQDKLALNDAYTFVLMAQLEPTPKYLGFIALSDSIKNDAKEVINEFKKLGLKTIILSGDNEKNVNYIATKLDIDEIYPKLLPDEKAQVLHKLKTNENKIIFVGDGINDILALNQADIGISVQSASDIAKNTGDVVLMNDELNSTLKLFLLSKKTLKIIKQNLFWAFCYNAICIPVASGILFAPFGLLLTPAYGALAMSISSICVVLNSLRLK